MASDGESQDYDFTKFLMNSDELLSVTQKFHVCIIPFLKKHKTTFFTIKGAPEIHGFSMTFGPYSGKTYALYISNQKEAILKHVFQKSEIGLKSIIGNKVSWTSNLLIDPKTCEAKEVEFIPIAFRGDFLLDTIKRSLARPADLQDLIHFAVMEVAKYLQRVIISMGFSCSVPHIVTNFDQEELEIPKIEQMDFWIDLQFIEKYVFWLTESQLLNKYAESDLETRIGRGLIKEAIPFMIQFEIKADYPAQKSSTVLAKPDFVVLSPLKPLAVYCDSHKYHEGKKDQLLKDRRIDRKLQALGFDVFRFSEIEITNNLKGCIEEIKSYYLGKDYALSSTEILLDKISRISTEAISEWERKFIESLLFKLSKKEAISLLEERILDITFSKRRSRLKK